ncbi:hypothetical protein AUEXF2481DRAFT_31576 [Aureobasidium subglaciale EXF-2481]|uniref:Uncharacterized protein n=1 Tax=Aureobasidium subglaciale (strain EXF-2481) TaxID=1043005 RepID=A0A074YGD7_AURSE|nr:uncharacterized protein AUEXF2481DRAFT_31576 [Aureobasidium subglaciale EXF-2481]KEQ93122.1 hypothetical protein AUEXF2481DRAFT_31576 [Aureobasidium subglaciale EXF-2481]
MTDAWFEYAVSPDGVTEDGCRPAEAQALKAYLRDEITIDKATDQITQPTEECDDPRKDLPNLWGLLQDALIELPDTQEKIVALVRAIRKRPDRGSVESTSTKFWFNLPSFANQWYDRNWWYYQNRWRDHSSKYRSPVKILEITNIARTEALVAVTDINILGEHLRFEGHSRICDALEDGKAVLDVEILAVREWLVHEVSTLLDMCRTPQKHCLLRSNRGFKEEIEKGEMYVSAKHQRDLWKGEGGTSMERWAFMTVFYDYIIFRI